MIARHRGEYPLSLMCRVLSVARSTFHAWLVRGPSSRAMEDAKLRVVISAITVVPASSTGAAATAVI